MDKKTLATHIGALCAAAALTFAGANPVYAAPNVVVNGGFELGTNFDTGWTQGGDPIGAQQNCNGPGPEYLEGHCAAFFSTFGFPTSLSQNLSLTAGATYNVSFGVEAFGDVPPPSFFTATLGGQSLLPNGFNPNPNTGGVYHVFTARHFASLSTESLVFTALDDPGSIFLDAVTVAVPEPASLALLGIGLAGVAASRRRRVS